MTLEHFVDAQSRRIDRVLVVVFFALAAGTITVLIRSLGDRSFWYDEAYTFCFVTASWSKFFVVLRHLDVGVGFYYVLVREWSTFAGTSEVGLRSFSALFAVLSVVALYYLAADLFSKRIAMTAAALLLCNSFWFQQAQTARVYSFSGFIAIVASLAFVRAMRTVDDYRWPAAYLTLMTILAASQLAIALGLFAGHALSYFSLRDRSFGWRRDVVLMFFVLVALAVTTYVVATIGATLLHTPVRVTFQSATSHIAELFGRKVAFAILGALVVLGITSSARADRSSALTLFVWTLAPIVLIVVMSMYDSAALGGRYMFGSLFPFLILASYGIWRNRRFIALASLTLAFFGEAYGLYQYMAEPWSKFDSEMIALASHVRADDAVLFAPPFMAVRVYVALGHDQLQLQDHATTFPGPLHSAWETVDQRMAEPAWSHVPMLRGKHLWIVTMVKTESPDGTCKSIEPEAAALHPGATTIICIGRE